MKRLTRVELECDNEATSQLAINLSRRPYLDRRIILRTPPNNFPRFLYKYLGPGLKDEWLRDILIDSKLYLRSPTDFNDPFDMRGHIIDELNIRKKRDYLEAMIKQMAPHLTWKQRNSHLNRLMVDTNLFEKLKKSLITVVKNHGISCFSIKPRSILMWSHYGQHHKGIALQFEYAKDVINFQFTLPIEYRKDYPTIEYYGDPSRHKEFVLRKYEDWSYEKEWRLVRHEKANTYHSFDSAALTGIILGCRIDPQEEDRVRAMIMERDKLGLGRLKLYKARLHEFKYRLVICKTQ